MTNSVLNQISKPISDELDEFQSRFKIALKSKVGVVDLVTKYILKQKGKKIRPTLVLLSSKVAGGITERSYRGAILVELLHTATLVHDDVVDQAEKRRGLPSINAVWKNKVAVLMGDYLLARGLMLSVEGEDYDFLKTITGTVKRMSEGELLQINKSRKINLDEDTYFRIISDKTASLLATCCEIGAASKLDDPAQIDAMRQFGENLGIAFQIRDDILDYVGSSSVIGKPHAADLREKKITLPLIYSLKNADSKQKKEIIKLVKNISEKGAVDKVVQYVKDLKGIDESYETARKYSERAKENIALFEDSPSKLALEALVDFVINRKN
ncbi:MAG: polyprenyl synthetase family protein [Melioribacteraceae bacterium]|nr:polyprenyl synthetase family protein [Melioribacteraceae bacterium]MCF8264022.1 polyprenyl synthetase family protein [Melioribacteraceae bacterium]MCF8412706.1 polyprenyl synthetase family protein [Melioribacteraceae bacterium]MCF8432527.1 polyprenyl synthetase family protein [Melioribacteraceae bacterium]